MGAISRFQFSAMLRASRAVLTNLQAGRLGMNVGKITASYYSRIYLDYVRRAFTPFIVPGSGSTPVALDGSGNPTASYEIVLSANPLSVDLGVYNCWCRGQITGVAKSSSTNTTVVNFSAPVYTAGDNTTRFTMTVVSGGGILGVVVSNPTNTPGRLRVLPATINGVAVTEAQSDDFHPDAITQMAMGTTIRSLDWIGVNGSTETDWTGSLAAGGDGSVRGKAQSLSEFCRFTRACGNADVWTNIPALASDDYITQYVTTADAAAAPGAKIYLEWANENWNFNFASYEQLTYKACKLAGTFAGATARFSTDANITSCVRDGAGTATAIVSGVPAFTTSGHKIYVAGITNITGGLVTTTAVADNGDGTWSLSWAEAGGAVTGTVVNSSHNYNSYIHTDVETGAVHYIVKGLTTYGAQPTPNFVSPYVMKGRYVVERLRAAYTIIQTLSGKSRWRICLNNALGTGSGNGLSENEAYSYAFERWGDHTWIYTVASAPYFAAETASQAAATAQDVITALSGNLDTFPQLLAREGNAAASWGHAKAFYEGGPANTNVGSAGALIGQAHRDATLTPNIGSLITRLLTYVRDLAQSGPFCFYQGGSVASFGSSNNQMWAIQEAGAVKDLTTPKALAFAQWGAASSQAAPMDGFTSGAIIIPTVWFTTFGSSDSNNCRIASPTAALNDCGIRVVKTLTGNFPIAVYACSTSAADWVSIWVNGVQVANQIPLTVQNPTAGEPGTPVWSSSGYPMSAGVNVVLIRIKPSGRTGTIGFNKIVSPDTPV